MRQKEIKKLALLALIMCINSVPVVAYAKDTKTNGEIIEQSKVKIESNWLTKEVASQLGKKVEKLTEQDFLNIKKIDLKKQNIKEEIPKEIALLKNLQYLDLNYSKITGEIPAELGDLPMLTHLDLGDNKIEKLPENIIKKVIDGKYTYCDIEGNEFKLGKGWYNLKGKLCYLDRNGERLKGVQKIDGKEYTFTDDGSVRDGWETDKNNNKFYYDKLNGLVKENWKSILGNWYYFNKDGIMQKGFQTVKGAKYYLDDNGIMVTGWKKIDNKYYYFSSTGAMQYGWLDWNGKTYYLDTSTGIMAASEDKMIDGKKRKFAGDGSVMTNVWIDAYTYVQPNGETVNTYSNYSHSNANYELFKYMTDVNNQNSVDSTAIRLHGGDTSNNCVYFTSEALRRIGVGIPTSVANTYQLENQLKGIGFKYSYDLGQLKPGDIVFTNGYTHVYTFMCWDKDGYAYIVDNQRTSYGNLVLHKRQVLVDTAKSDRATHFFYY